ncbi:outer membrane immunogenic protein [Rhizobium pisi]|uniref:Outer membrane immunogenic protein n=1 Tax=Rhizobium pisi TaxID=574561 RepID=A0A3R9GUX3_9HYPH|nr:outer membrane protein [Rhizobium pisi]MBB3138287.1 outer membrane immunogenic protein [Rhizobium pisi]RSB63467.1 porin family protein [Rhizobium pisi]TCA43489.1 porin family protein [Rhizobium pisi]
MHIRLVACAALALSVAIPAAAADLTYETPAAQPGWQVSSAYDWSGFYLGAQGGYSWSQTKILGSDQDANSGSAGLHAGYNFQSGNIVYGIENDFNYNFEKNGDADLEWDASGRARLGYAWGRTLFFATAGAAAAGGKVDIPAVGKKDGILIGWTAGGGIEHAVTDNILVRGEYRHLDFGDKDFGSAIGDVGASQDKLLFGTSYKF